MSNGEGFAGGVFTPETARTAAATRWQKKQEADAARMQSADGEPHPLFPTAPGEPVPQIAFIDLVRYERGRGPVYCPRTFPAVELVDLSDITQQYGGGAYELIGRGRAPNGGPGVHLRSRRVTLPGESIPFDGEDAVARAGAAAAMSPAPAGDPMMAMVLAMMQQQQQASDRQMQMLVQMMQSQTQTTIAMLTSGAGAQSKSMESMVGLLAPLLAAGSSGKGELAQLLAMMAQMNQQQVATLLQVIPRPDGTDPLAKLDQILAIAAKIKGGESDSSSLKDLLEGFGQAAQGIAALDMARSEAGRTGNPLADPAGAAAAAAAAAASTPAAAPDPGPAPAPAPAAPPHIPEGA